MFVDVAQNSEEWDIWRMDKVTSSKFAVVMAHEGKAFGEPAKKYAKEIAANIITGEIEEKESYTNQFMKDGHQYEPIAVEYYEREKFISTSNGGFFYSKDERFGDSPDRNAGKNGTVEVKCVIRTTQIDRIEKKGYDTTYKWQIQGHIWLGEKQWCDFVQFCHSMPENARLYVFRVERDEDMINRLKARLEEFWKLVESNMRMIKNYEV